LEVVIVIGYIVQEKSISINVISETRTPVINLGYGCVFPRFFCVLIVGYIYIVRSIAMLIAHRPM